MITNNQVNETVRRIRALNNWCCLTNQRGYYVLNNHQTADNIRAATRSWIISGQPVQIDFISVGQHLTGLIGVYSVDDKVFDALRKKEHISNYNRDRLFDETFAWLAELDIRLNRC